MKDRGGQATESLQLHRGSDYRLPTGSARCAQHRRKTAAAIRWAVRETAVPYEVDVH